MHVLIGRYFSFTNVTYIFFCIASYLFWKRIREALLPVVTTQHIAFSAHVYSCSMHEMKAIHVKAIIYLGTRKFKLAYKVGSRDALHEYIDGFAVAY